MSLVAYASSDSENESEEPLSTFNEKEIKCASSNKGVNNVTVKQRETVKITIPSLDQFKDEEEFPEPVKKPIAKTGSGLFGLLPPPKYSKPVEKSFVPHVLSRPKSKPKIPKTVVQKTSSDEQTEGIPYLLLPDIEENSDSDENEESSVGEKHSSPAIDYFSLESCSSEVAVPEVTDTHLFSTLPKPSHSSSAQNIITDERFSQIACPTSEGTQVSGNYSGQTSVDATEVDNWNAYNVDLCSNVHSDAQINAPDNFHHHMGESTSFLQDEGFKRLKGRRKKEEINLIDVNADDQLVGKEEWLLQSLTEEQTQRPSKRRHDMPTQQQKRKHQITYLAFQAKERELDLKNQWSLNSRTKRETQAKYGF